MQGLCAEACSMSPWPMEGEMESGGAAACYSCSTGEDVFHLKSENLYGEDGDLKRLAPATTATACENTNELLNVK